MASGCRCDAGRRWPGAHLRGRNRLMASIKRRPERGNKWQATYRGPDGRERARLFDRRADAERWVAQAQADLSRGTYIDPAAGKITLADYGDAWLARMAPTWR